MKGFKLEPVRWATWTLALLTAVLGANELVDQLGGADVIPSAAVPYLLFAEAALALVLGKAVRDRVTPLARPRGVTGVPLVPKTAKGATPTPRVTRTGRGPDPDGSIGDAGMASW